MHALGVCPARPWLVPKPRLRYVMFVITLLMLVDSHWLHICAMPTIQSLMVILESLHLLVSRLHMRIVPWIMYL